MWMLFLVEYIMRWLKSASHFDMAPTLSSRFIRSFFLFFSLVCSSYLRDVFHIFLCAHLHFGPCNNMCVEKQSASKPNITSSVCMCRLRSCKPISRENILIESISVAIYSGFYNKSKLLNFDSLKEKIMRFNGISVTSADGFDQICYYYCDLPISGNKLVFQFKIHVI